MIRAVEVRCTGNKGQCRRIVAVLFWPEDPSEGPPKLRIYPDKKMIYTLTRDLTGSVPLFCYTHTPNVDYELIELRPLLAGPLAQALGEGKTITADLDP